MYYGDPAQFGRMVRFYGQFIRAGDLAFDIGAHVGSRSPARSRLGARVVAVEPQPACMAVLRRCYGFRSNVLLVQSAVGEETGEQEMLISDREPTVSTLSAELAVACIDRLSELGDYEFNWSPDESMRVHFPAWVRGHDLTKHLLALPADSNPGDFYARLSRTT
jgi:hypothetical protein